MILIIRQRGNHRVMKRPHGFSILTFWGYFARLGTIMKILCQFIFSGSLIAIVHGNTPKLSGQVIVTDISDSILKVTRI